ncbi:jg26770 [Pararge aegeria aegeria]|uniref:Jg26770 protein n=1 Tax=Pararge aegeria aegeria TaxID=348720 RepID=A0A8S4QQL0_9NEOP|nr:jg26770 [Pararge aegeria aegeria]
MHCRRFSTHVVLRNLTVPYWEKLGELFAHMMYSVSNKLDPDKYFRFLRPPFFTLDTQHDSSEFLGVKYQPASASLFLVDLPDTVGSAVWIHDGGN